MSCYEIFIVVIFTTTGFTDNQKHVATLKKKKKISPLDIFVGSSQNVFAPKNLHRGQEGLSKENHVSVICDIEYNTPDITLTMIINIFALKSKIYSFVFANLVPKNSENLRSSVSKVQKNKSKKET